VRLKAKHVQEAAAPARKVIDMRVNEFKAELAALKAKMREQTKEAFSKLWDDAPGEIVAVGWNQYTPGFNDGDPCTFRVSGPFWMVKKTDEWAEDLEEAFEEDAGGMEEWEYESFENRYTLSDENFSDEVRAFCKEFEELLNMLEYDDPTTLETMFGEAASVLIVRGRETLVTDYDCGY
jgi:hypothetical protein